MPPKKGQQQANKKTEQKKKEKIIEDKTFGLKNKKGAKQQNFIKSVQHQVKYGNQKSSRQVEEATETKKKAVEKKKKEQDELNMLFRPVATQKVAKGVDPKSVVCAFFKQGSCGKGDKCKFSHDLSLERKSEKRNIYDDESKETMDDWDETKLKEVVEKKHGEADKKVPKTNIVCKYFIKAIEDSKYGWFWNCPNGEKCIYKHTLPPGFVLKKKKKLDEPEEEKISLEELIEQERAKLGPNQTKITLETFRAWKKRKIEEKKEKLAQEQKKKKNDFKEGKALGITGREVFQFNPDLILADDAEADEGVIEREQDENQVDDGPIRELNADTLASEAQEATATGTVSTSQSREGPTSSTLLQESNEEDQNEQGDADDANKLGAAAALPPQGTADGMGDAMVNGDAIVMDVEVDEDLFDEELENIDEDLENIDLD
ncbi:Zinc finger CCCH domain-containing protein 15 [Holothuria leucospilota]|uniref:Zinc finger CCCH domain-containing protein 15 n=1 Tax=Holothuria leucospilota TaxID=206669 RepID=A0A9Q0YFX8_HOLLE|nr:Zinc finger CCCH domain-containing protein 15 [Holothuria leucospilota]